MDKFISIVQRFGEPLAAKANSNKELSSIRDGMIVVTPVSIVGAIALIFSQFPFLDEYAPGLAGFLSTFFDQLGNITIGMLTLYVIIGVANEYGNKLGISRVYSIVTAFLAFLLLSDFSFEGSGAVNGEIIDNVSVNGVIPTTIFSAGSMFTGILVTVVSLRIYWFLAKNEITIKMPDAVPENVTRSFTSLVPMVIVSLIFALIRYLFLLTPYGFFNEFIYTWLTRPLLAMGDSVWAVIVFVLFQQLLWYFGIHGANVVNSVWEPIKVNMMTENMEAFAAGQDLPYIFSKTFWEVYSGVFNFAIPLLLVMVVQSQRLKSIGKFSFVPSIFLVHETFLFSVPVVLNPLMFIPWVLVYVLQTIAAYGLAVIGFAPIPTIPVPWTTPIILSGFISTNFNIMGAIAQVILLLIGVIGYYPFIKALDNQYLREEGEEGTETTETA